jgi:hypothetical protein
MRNDDTRNGANGGPADAIRPQAGRNAARVPGEVAPWQGGEVDSVGRGADLDQPNPARPAGDEGQPRHSASVTVRMPAQEPVSGKKTVRVRRSLLMTLVCLIVLLVVAIVALVKFLPAHTSTALAVQDKATSSPRASATRPSPADSATSASSSPSTASSPAASSPAASATAAATSSGSTVVAPGGAAGAPLADLSALNPVNQSYISSLSTGPQQIGSITYQDSVRFTCDTPSGYLVYDVAGYKYLTTLIGIPSDASNATGNTMTITFYKDGSATQLMTPVTVSLDHPQSVHLNLQGASQLEVACSAISTTSQDSEYMDVAFGNATIGPS